MSFHDIYVIRAYIRDLYISMIYLKGNDLRTLCEQCMISLALLCFTRSPKFTDKFHCRIMVDVVYKPSSFNASSAAFRSLWIYFQQTEARRINFGDFSLHVRSICSIVVNIHTHVVSIKAVDLSYSLSCTDDERISRGAETGRAHAVNTRN